MPDHLSHPIAAVEAGGGVPEEIGKAIDGLVDAEHDQIKKGGKDAEAWCEAAGVCHTARAALDATIARHLSAAQRCCDSYAHENQQLSDKADAALARAERAEKALEVARSQLVTLGGDPSYDRYGDQIQQAVLDEIDAALSPTQEP